MQSFVSAVYSGAMLPNLTCHFILGPLPQIMRVNINQKTKVISDLNLSVNLIFELHKESFILSLSTFTLCLMCKNFPAHFLS